MPQLDKIENFQSAAYRWLSNFWPVPVKLDGLEYPTTEHAFQAAKTLDPKQRFLISALTDPGRAKQAGKKVTLRANWEQIKISVMRELLVQKFAIPELRERLLNTKDMILIEGNYWNDTFWGVCKGVGENHLGKLLMEIREEIRCSNVKT